MCGRYVILTKLKLIEKRFDAIFEQPDIFSNSANISVGDYAPVIANDRPMLIQQMQFGLTPSWAKKKTYFFNARSEGDNNAENDPNYRGALGLINKPAFRGGIRYKRCLVIADAFIEGPMKEKLSMPFLVYRVDGRPMAFAGIWDEWTDHSTGEIVRSFAIITTTAYDVLTRIGHERSPVILTEVDEKRWLEKGELADTLNIIRASNTYELNAYPISPNIKNPKVKNSILLAPIGERLKKEYTYEVYQEIELQGMGYAPARKRQDQDHDSNI